MVLRSAAAAASADTRIHRASLDRLAAAQQPMPAPWPDDARQALSALLLAGPRAIPVAEALDPLGLRPKALPAWRALPHNPPRHPHARSPSRTPPPNAAAPKPQANA